VVNEWSGRAKTRGLEFNFGFGCRVRVFSAAPSAYAQDSQKGACGESMSFALTPTTMMTQGSTDDKFG
jgi:hypothetical protein